MEKVLVPLFLLLLLLQFSSLLFLSSAYTLPDEYFINCGSDSNATFGTQTFIGDIHYPSNSISTGQQSSHVEDTNPSTDTSLVLYQTARIYRQTSSYKFDITQNGTYVVRLHFHAFSSSENLSGALFNVSTSQQPKNQKNDSSIFSLLSNFSVGNSTVVKDFLLSINVGKFKIHFIPSQETSLAFVNAIEVFLAPDNFINNTAPRINPSGGNGNYSGLLSQALQTVYRINVGGQKLTPYNDTMMRTWFPDDDFLLIQAAAKTSTPYSERPKYMDGFATEFTAPDGVYKTAKQLNTPSFTNISWRFNVSKNATYLVRVHFCDIVSGSLNILQFDLYIYSNFSQRINPYIQNQTFLSLATPFYLDFVVDSSDSGIMNISVASWNESQVQNAFLNGLEIMEFMKESGFVPTERESNKSSSLFVIVGSVGGGVSLICILLAVFFGLKYRKAKAIETSDKPSWEESSYNKISERSGNSSSVLNLDLGLKKPFSEIQEATNNFDENLLIGQGGFGKVYKGTLRNGTEVAVKRSEPGEGQGLSEFETEIMVLSKIRHRHLVSLVGYCDERCEMILVYEFMKKGTLREHLYGDSEGSFSQSQLSWEKRLEICIGAAKGLEYLHTGGAGRIFHRDVKSTNILLDENYVAKVADFGLSKSSTFDQTHVSTAVKGSFGYFDPEYFRCYQLTDKSDVYSFGVVLLEVVCARKVIDQSLPRDQVNLVGWAMSWQKKGQLEKIIDPFLVDKINPASLRKFGETAEKCLKDLGVDRPTMRDVVWDLELVLGLQQIVHRDPYEDSTVDASFEVPMPVLQRFPSHSVTVLEEDTSIVRDYGSDSTASEVFSQLRIYGAR